MATAALLFSDRIIRATGAESNNQAKEVADRMRLPKPDIPVLPEAVSLPSSSASSEKIRELWPRLSEAIENHFEERNHPSMSLRDGPPKETEGPLRKETSQSVETLSRKQEWEENPEKGHPMSSQEQITTLRAASKPIPIQLQSK